MSYLIYAQSSMLGLELQSAHGEEGEAHLDSCCQLQIQSYRCLYLDHIPPS